MFRPRVKYTFVLPAEKANAVYYPGEIVTGQLLIESSAPVLLTGLQMRLTGEGKVTIVRQEGNTQRRMHRTETYLETCKLVQDLERLPVVNAEQPNTCLFEFSFFLLPGLPPSFVSPMDTWGYVSYAMELIRVEAAKEKTLNKTKIIVAPLLTFERMPSAHDPVVREGQGAPHWFCCVTERNITVRIWVDRAGVFAGDILPFHALIINNSQDSIQSSYLTMKRRWVYHTSYETMETQGKEGLFVKVVRRAVVPPGGSLTWGDHGPAIVLPAGLIPSGPPGCSVMDLSYELSFTVVPAGMVHKMKLVLPILVGAALPESLREEVEGNTAAYFDVIARQRLLQQMAASIL